MKLRNTLLLLPATLTAAAVFAFPTRYFAPRSGLAEGRWVKVSVDTTGVYQLPDTMLARLGFSDPRRVAVFGRGALPSEGQFVLKDGTVAVDSNLCAVPVLADSTGLLFYGIGREWVDFLPPEPPGEGEEPFVDGYFKRTARHIYSRRGYYLLTDAAAPMPMDTLPFPPADAVVTTPAYALDYMYLGKPKVYGIKGNGQIYFDTIVTRNQVLNWRLTPPGLIPASPFTLTGDFYTTYTSKGNENAKWSLWIGNREYTFASTSQISTTMANNFTRPVRNSLAPGSQVAMSLHIGSASVSNAGVDYLGLTYRRTLPAAKGTDGDMSLPAAAGGYVCLPLASSYSDARVLEISNPQAPALVPKGADGSPVLAAGSRVTVFDRSEQQRRVRVEGEVRNTDLHSQLVSGADLIILTIPALRLQADRLAQLHRDRDSLRVVVAEVGDVYNEFNSGTPDPMAYRTMVKMAYQNNPGKTHLNLLLFGPMRAEALGIKKELDYDSFIIAFQDYRCSQDGDAQNINDFLGMMIDTRINNLEFNNVEVGVGVLPVAGEQEAAQIIDKIERYLDYEGYADVSNKVLAVSGTGDNNLHTEGVVRMTTELNNRFNSSLLTTPLVCEAFSKDQITGRLRNLLNSNFTFAFYLGHGSEFKLDKDVNLFSKSEATLMENNVLPFFIFGTCDNTGFDVGNRGLGESMVIDSPNGLIGAILSSRKAYSNQNEQFVKQVLTHLTQTPAGLTIDTMQTIGQVYARAKTAMRNTYENTFQLMCDPALKLHIPLLAANPDNTAGLSFVPGTRVKLTGPVTRRGTSVGIDDFSGMVTAKVLAPARSETCPNLINPASTKHPVITYADEVLATFRGTAADGRFEVDVEIPQSYRLRAGVPTRIAISAYDPVTHRGASGVTTVTIAETAADPGQLDVTAPVIETLEYDPELKEIRFTVSDDRSLNIDNPALNQGFAVTLDGKYYGGVAHTLHVEPGTPVKASGTIPCADLARGEHAVSVAISDYAGNEAEQSMSFRIGDELPLLSLEAETLTAGSESLRFTLHEASPQKGRLMVASHEGTTVISLPFEGTEIDCPLEDAEGQRLAPGLYRAWVITDAPAYGSSAPLTFAVLPAE